MQITPDVHTGRGRRRTLFPKLPLSPRQYRWISLLIFLAVPLVSFSIVEILNYNNPFTSFTPLQVALNLVWYYLGEAFFYFLRGGRPDISHPLPPGVRPLLGPARQRRIHPVRLPGRAAGAGLPCAGGQDVPRPGAGAGAL